MILPMKTVARILTLLSVLLLSACIAVSKVSLTSQSVEARGDLGLGAATAPAQDSWWRALQDSQLDRLLDTALAENPTLGLALARLREAQAQIDATRAGLWPNVSYDADTTRE